MYSELVRLFGEARLHRQVIIVIHNANLVVHTDVDQVSLASCVKPKSGSLPEFHYVSGGPKIRSYAPKCAKSLKVGKLPVGNARSACGSKSVDEIRSDRRNRGAYHSVMHRPGVE